MGNTALCFPNFLQHIISKNINGKALSVNRGSWRTPNGRLPFGHWVNIENLHPHFYIRSLISSSELPKEDRTSIPIIQKKKQKPRRVCGLT